jgi:hypothetical protein
MKNLWMSMWLSAANSWSNAARGQFAAEARRNQAAMLDDMNRQLVAFWMPGEAAKRPPRKRSRSRR